MISTIGTSIYISERGGDWVKLEGYAGGLSLGISTNALPLDGYSDGLPRFTKGNSNGMSSAIAFRNVDGDPGQELLRYMSGLNHDGIGSVKIVKPQGGTIIAEGIFLGSVGNAWDGVSYQGHTVTFNQVEPEIYEN